jgi:hypothetical protein
MTTIYAKPLVDGKFWIVEEDGHRVGTLRLKEDNKFILSSQNGEKFFSKKSELTEVFGKNFFPAKKVKTTISNLTDLREVHGYPSSCFPHNAMYDIQRHLPLYTKSPESKSVYCAGYYTIKFNKGWVRSFCPKLITIERYQYYGPFKTELEMKQVLANAKTD